MAIKTTGQQAAEEARAACNKLSQKEKTRLTKIAMAAIRKRDRHPSRGDQAEA